MLFGSNRARDLETATFSCIHGDAVVKQTFVFHHIHSLFEVLIESTITVSGYIRLNPLVISSRACGLLQLCDIRGGRFVRASVQIDNFQGFDPHGGFNSQCFAAIP